MFGGFIKLNGPVINFHGDTVNFIILLAQQCRSNRGIHPTAQPNRHFYFFIFNYLFRKDK
jgi:hypothetical protein